MKKSRVLTNRKRELKVRLQKLEKRRWQVDSIFNDVRNELDDNIGSIRNQNRSIHDNSEAGFNYFFNILNQNNAIDSINERDTYSDDNISEIIGNLQSELNRLNQEMMSLKNQISRLDRQINAAIEEERCEFL